MPIDKLIKAYRIAEKIVLGGRVEGLSSDKPIVWDGVVKARFVEWMKANGRSDGYIRASILYLDRYVGRISKPEDVVEAFGRCVRGRRHLAKALRNLLKFYEIVEGYPEDYIDRLRRAIPKVRTGVDYREVSEDDVVETFRMLRDAPLKYAILYMLILDGGVRLTHAVRLINEFNPSRLEHLGGFCRYTLGLEEGTKHTFYVYMRSGTAEKLRSLSGVKLTVNSVKKYLGRHRGLVNPKLLRKFAYNRMILSGIPETVADFINGRKPRTVGGQHYMWLRVQADTHYPRYLEYLEKLYEKIDADRKPEVKQSLKA